MFEWPNESDLRQGAEERYEFSGEKPWFCHVQQDNVAQDCGDDDDHVVYSLLDTHPD